MPVVQNFPLAFCHLDTINTSTDTVEKDNVTNANFAVGSLYLLHRPHHRWFYADQQTSDEVWMFKTWEGETDFRKPPRQPSCLHPLTFHVVLTAFFYLARLYRLPSTLLV